MKILSDLEILSERCNILLKFLGETLAAPQVLPCVQKEVEAKMREQDEQGLAALYHDLRSWGSGLPSVYWRFVADELDSVGEADNELPKPDTSISLIEFLRIAANSDMESVSAMLSNELGFETRWSYREVFRSAAGEVFGIGPHLYSVDHYPSIEDLKRMKAKAWLNARNHPLMDHGIDTLSSANFPVPFDQCVDQLSMTLDIDRTLLGTRLSSFEVLDAAICANESKLPDVGLPMWSYFFHLLAGVTGGKIELVQPERSNARIAVPALVGPNGRYYSPYEPMVFLEEYWDNVLQWCASALLSAYFADTAPLMQLHSFDALDASLGAVSELPALATRKFTKAQYMEKAHEIDTHHDGGLDKNLPTDNRVLGFAKLTNRWDVVSRGGIYRSVQGEYMLSYREESICTVCFPSAEHVCLYLLFAPEFAPDLVFEALKTNILDASYLMPLSSETLVVLGDYIESREQSRKRSAVGVSFFAEDWAAATSPSSELYGIEASTLAQLDVHLDYPDTSAEILRLAMAYFVDHILQETDSELIFVAGDTGTGTIQPAILTSSGVQLELLSHLNWYGWMYNEEVLALDETAKSLIHHINRDRYNMTFGPADQEVGQW